MSFARLDEHCRKLEALEHALAMLGADEATHMAVGGGEKRAEAMSALAGMHHRQATAPAVAEWIEAAEREALNEEQAAALRELRRSYTNLTCLPSDFVERTDAGAPALRAALARSSSQERLGRLPARAGGRRSPWCARRRRMRAEALGLDPYDALMEQYDPGNRAADIAPLFAELKAFLVDFVPVALAAQEKRLAKAALRPLSGVYPIDRQRELGLAMMGAVGFDFTRGSLSISHHPFCGGVPTDVRITTRYRTTDFLSALMGVLHETGHALYEQNLPAAMVALAARQGARHGACTRARACSSKSSSAATRPSGTGRCRWWSGRLGESWTVDEILPHVHHVERGLIRVDADEVTYPLHVILRFELERALVAGRLAPADIPEAWDAEDAGDYLGLSTIDIPEDGPMQDVHWPSGAFGYFPSYTLGAMMAAQQWSALAARPPFGRRRPARKAGSTR